MQTLIVLSLLLAAQPSKVVVISHRGEHIANPENTMLAFAEATRVGSDFYEVDVRTTSDGHLVLMHDGTVDRTTSGKGEVSKMTFAEIRMLTVGKVAQVPTFDEALAYAESHKIGVYVDIKNASAKDLVDHIARHNMTDRVVMYCGRNCKELGELEPRLRLMPEARNPDFAQKLIDDLKLKVLAYDNNDFKQETIAVAKKNNVQIYVDRLGPADNPKVWQEAIDQGADGIQTDHPEELIKYLKSKNLY